LRGSARRWLDEGAAWITTPAFAAGLGAGIGSGIGSVVAGPTVTWTGGRERHRRRTTRNLPRLSVACANLHQAPAIRSTRQRFENCRLSTTGSGVCGERASIPGLSIRPGFLCSACERQQENDDKQAHPPWQCKRDASLATKDNAWLTPPSPARPRRGCHGVGRAGAARKSTAGSASSGVTAGDAADTRRVGTAAPVTSLAPRAARGSRPPRSGTETAVRAARQPRSPHGLSPRAARRGCGARHFPPLPRHGSFDRPRRSP
jgi:hypothetical protein